MPHLSLSLLGAFNATLDGVQVTGFRSDKIRALLAYLSLHAGLPVRRETLASLFWSEWSDADAASNLRKSLHRLRQTLDAHRPGFCALFLTITRQDVLLEPAALTLDVAHFEALLTRVATHPHRHLHVCRACLERLAEAVALYRGELLNGFALQDALLFDEWLLVERERLHQQVMMALVQLATAHERRGELVLADRFARQQLVLEPWREEAYRQRMRLLALGGQRSQALEQYARCRSALAQDLGIEPSPETVRLYTQITHGEGPLAMESNMTSVLRSFPPQFTPFVGRTVELEQILERLIDPDCRLLTLTGPGGIGKTRLALRAAEQVAALQLVPSGGVVFVALEELSSARLLVGALGRSLDLHFDDQRSPLAQIVDHLRHRVVLLVLDGFDHLVQDAMLLCQLLAAVSGLKILITSREPLAVQAEWLFRVTALTYPEAGLCALEEGEDCLACPFSAVQLFIQAAQRAQATFAPGRETCPAILAICRALEGVPLALELAAARLRYQPLELLTREVMTDLDALASPYQDAPAHHRSLRTVFERSWMLLTGEEKTTLALISIFRGGFTLTAAQAVAGSPEAAHLSRHLDSLVNKSLLRRLPDGRYDLHELLQQFAAERVADALRVTMRERYVWYYLDLVRLQDVTLEDSEPELACSMLPLEWRNMHQAWVWANDLGQTAALETAGAALERLLNLVGMCGQELPSAPFSSAPNSGSPPLVLSSTLPSEPA